MRSLRLILIAHALAVPASLAAQQITPGTWTGWITPPGGQTRDATFDVRLSADTTRITIKVMDRSIEASWVKVEKDRLLFAFSPGGNTVQCTLLLKDDKSYVGDCGDGQGDKGVILMRPPKA